MIIGCYSIAIVSPIEYPVDRKVTAKDTPIEEIEEPSKKDDPATELHCALCKKSFKTQSQWKNHEQSKKHQMAMAELDKFTNPSTSGHTDEKKSKGDSKAARRLKKKQMIDDIYEEAAQTDD
jgi:hypothetical protein